MDAISLDFDVFIFCLDVFCSSDIGEMGVQRGMALHQLFIDFQEVNDSEEECAATVSLGVLYLPMELVYIYNIAQGPVNNLSSSMFPAQSGPKEDVSSPFGRSQKTRGTGTEWSTLVYLLLTFRVIIQPTYLYKHT